MHRSGKLKGYINDSRTEFIKRSQCHRTEGWSTKREKMTYEKEDQLTLRMFRHIDTASGLDWKEARWACK
eukprot:2136620-Heterocapsa_arctica.AAC.1